MASASLEHVYHVARNHRRNHARSRANVWHIRATSPFAFSSATTIARRSRYNVLQFSLYRRSSKPLAISPLVLPTLPMKRQGLTPFTFSRFLVPWLCDYQGWALFLDIDFLALGDVAELFALDRRPLCRDGQQEPEEVRVGQHDHVQLRPSGEPRS